MIRATVLGLATLLSGCTALSSERKTHLSPIIKEQSPIFEKKRTTPADIYKLYLYTGYNHETDLPKEAILLANNSPDSIYYVPGKTLVKKEGDKAYELNILSFRTYIHDSLFESSDEKLSSFCNKHTLNFICDQNIIRNIQYFYFGSKNMYTPKIIKSHINQQSLIITGDPLTIDMNFVVQTIDQQYQFSFDELMNSYATQKKPIDIVVMPRQTSKQQSFKPILSIPTDEESYLVKRKNGKNERKLY